MPEKKKEKLYKEYYMLLKNNQSPTCKKRKTVKELYKKHNIKENTFYKYIKQIQIRRAGAYDVIERLERKETLKSIKKYYEIK